MKRAGFAVLVFLLCSANSCGDSNRRSTERARIDAIRVLNAPVICDGSESAGWVCGTNAGRLVWCPAKEMLDCELIPKIPSTNPQVPAPTPSDAGTDTRVPAEREP